ncbi:MAG: LTA synthase family protein, partial [Clostridia bacterium]
MKKKIGMEFIKILTLILFSIFLLLFTLYYSIGAFPFSIFFSYFDQPLLVVLNFIPILSTIFFIYALSRKISLSVFFTSLIYIPLTIVNYFKIALRNDPLLMEDFMYIKEAFNMQKNYVLNFRKGMYLAIIFCIISTIILYFVFDRKKEKTKITKKNILIRIFSSFIILLIFIVCLKPLYFNNKIYKKISNTELINIWSDTQQYISRGTIYSFLHSYCNINTAKPDGYNEEQIEEELKSYTYYNIDEDKKVNIISIMLEAYNDFSKFDTIEYEKNPYALLDEIRKKAYCGKLCTDIFAGGTITTERSFITGYSNQTSFRTKTNSFVRYFLEQGYTVEGSHPCYDWFYNRVNINENLGFPTYYFYENKYAELSNGSIAPDSILFDEILNLYNEGIENGKPYFSFNVTYQNHGPYSKEKCYDESYIKIKPEYTEEEVNIFNNYLTGIEDTTNQIYNMINALKESNEPVVLILFGDHNPWLGDNNSVYSMLGINLNLDTEEGFYNYYCTPYIIWANDAAKDVLDKDFVGEGPTISPCFLMSEF